MGSADFEVVRYEPVNVPPTRLVVLLHGYGRDASAMEKMALAVRDAMPDALVLCPQAPETMDNAGIADGRDDHVLHLPEEIRLGPGAADPGAMRQWFNLEGGLPQLMPRLKAVAERLNAFIDNQRDMLGLADKAVAVMGFSQGAGVAVYTALARTEELGALICHSGIVIERPDNTPDFVSRPKFLSIYGDCDPEFPAARYHHSFDLLNAWSGGKGEESVVPGLGHKTSAESRAACADYLARTLG